MLLPAPTNGDTDNLPGACESLLQLVLVLHKGRVLDKDVGEGCRVRPGVPAHDSPHMHLLPVQDVFSVGIPPEFLKLTFTLCTATGTGSNDRPKSVKVT